ICLDLQYTFGSSSEANNLNAQNNRFSSGDMLTGNLVPSKTVYLRRSTQARVYRYVAGSNNATGVRIQ
ncbi:MAG: hypothetical protein AAGA95_22360, partial [Pseudomonadota bacterium]